MFKRILAGAVLAFIVLYSLWVLAVEQTGLGKFPVLLAFLGHMLALSIAAVWFFRGPRGGFWPTFRGCFPRIWVVEALTYWAVETAVGAEWSLDLLAYCFGSAAPHGVVLSILLAFALPTLWGREPEELDRD
jgi:hypothetical protein